MLYVEESADLDRQLAVRVELAHGVEPSEALAEQVGGRGTQKGGGCVGWQLFRAGKGQDLHSAAPP